MNKFISIDIGNTHPNVALFHDGEIFKTMLLYEFDEFQEYPNGLVCLVGQIEEHFRENLSSYQLLPPIIDQMFFDMPVNYSQTLGQDRLACAYQIFSELAKDDKDSFAIIDVGTFITVDLVTNKGFCGGYILPGLSLISDTYKKGALLKAIEIQTATDLEGLPHCTQEAINKGYSLMYRDFLASFIQTHKPAQIFLTGGRADHFKHLLPDQSLVKFSPHLLHKSLLAIGSLSKS